MARKRFGNLKLRFKKIKCVENGKFCILDEGWSPVHVIICNSSFPSSATDKSCPVQKVLKDMYNFLDFFPLDTRFTFNTVTHVEVTWCLLIVSLGFIYVLEKCPVSHRTMCMADTIHVFACRRISIISIMYIYIYFMSLSCLF